MFKYKRTFAQLFMLVLSIYVASSPMSRLQAQNDKKRMLRVDMTLTMRYSPDKLTINAGDIVEWKNKSPFDHTVTADPAVAKDKKHVVLPEGVNPFNSGTIGPNETFRYTFSVPGTYKYFCIPHEGAGMIGEIEVK